MLEKEDLMKHQHTSEKRIDGTEERLANNTITHRLGWRASTSVANQQEKERGHSMSPRGGNKERKQKKKKKNQTSETKCIGAKKGNKKSNVDWIANLPEKEGRVHLRRETGDSWHNGKNTPNQVRQKKPHYSDGRVGREKKKGT